MARVLESLKPLLALIGQADDAVGAAQSLSDAAERETGNGLVQQLAALVTDKKLAAGVLQHAGVIDSSGQLTEQAAIRLAQVLALAEALHENQCDLVVTVPTFLRPALATMVRESPAISRPLETAATMVSVAREARERLVIAAPFLHPNLVETLLPHVKRLVGARGKVLVLTRAIGPAAAGRSKANHDSVVLLRTAASRAPDRLAVRSWEENGLGIHCKVVLADQASAYLGSANLTVHGAQAQAEIGVLLRGPQLKTLAAWLDQISSVLTDSCLTEDAQCATSSAP
jgi:phosphatidylserine/phosphatidylglycerophosphate/cardiolipin synthase-like enzyme